MTASESSPSTGKTLIKAIVVTSVLVIAWVGLSWAVEGSTMATRTATKLVMPTALIWLTSLMLAIWFALQSQRLASLAFVMVCVMVYVAGNGYVSSAMMDRLEWPEQPMPDQPVRAAVVLGGGMSATPDGTPELGRDGERIFSAAQLYHAGKVGAIICTGMSSDGLHHPSDDGRDVLISAGVPSDAIFRIKGETTSQEMLSLRQFLDSPPAGFPPAGPVLLVTSAFHMNRAMRLAEGQGVEMLPFPCAYRGSVERGFSATRWIPGADAMQDFALAQKEWLAGLVGR